VETGLETGERMVVKEEERSGGKVHSVR